MGCVFCLLELLPDPATIPIRSAEIPKTTASPWLIVSFFGGGAGSFLHPLHPLKDAINRPIIISAVTMHPPLPVSCSVRTPTTILIFQADLMISSVVKLSFTPVAF